MPEEKEITPSEELSPEEQELAFEAGFNRVLGIDPPKPSDSQKTREEKAEQETSSGEPEKEEIKDEKEEPKEEETSKENKVKEESTEEKQETKAPEVPAGLTEDRLNEILADRLQQLEAKRLAEKQAEERALYGKIGSVVDNYVKRRKPADRKKAEAAIQGLAEDGFEDIAKRMREIVSGISPEEEKEEKPQLDPAVVQAQIKEAISRVQAEHEERTAKLKQEFMFSVIEASHPDYRDHLKPGTDFVNWFKNLSPEKKKYYGESTNGFVVAKALTEYKSQRENLQKEKEEKEQRLKKAVVPKTTETPPQKTLTDEDYMLRGFNRVVHGS